MQKKTGFRPIGLFFVLFLVFSNSQSFGAGGNVNEQPQVQQEAADFIKILADRALTSLQQTDISLAEQESRFRDILLEGFDVSYIGKISLGRHKRQASHEDLVQYDHLFPEYLVKIYTTRLTKLQTKAVEVSTVLPNGKRDMYVRSLVSDVEGKSYDVDWRVRPRVGSEGNVLGYKIIDVKIEGISMARTQRDDFTARIAESGMTGLITFMRDIITKPSEEEV